MIKRRAFAKFDAHFNKLTRPFEKNGDVLLKKMEIHLNKPTSIGKNRHTFDTETVTMGVPTDIEATPVGFCPFLTGRSWEYSG